MKYKLFRTIRFIGRPFLKILYRPCIIGKENIPDNGAVILAGNHTKILDAVLMVGVPDRVTHILAKKELFNSKIGNWFFSTMTCIPVNRSKKDKNAMHQAEEALKNGKVIGIFPEGTVNKTSDIILPFKYGVVSLASKTNAKIVPFAITGKYKLFRKSIKIEYGKAYKLKSSDLEKENNILMNKVKELILKGSKNEIF